MAVRAKDGAVTLVGSLPTNDIMQAIKAAKGVEEVASITDNLRTETQDN